MYKRQVLRQRARHRLLGAAVLVVLAVIGFPFLFDTQPRPVSVDIAVEIPDKNKSRSPANPVEAAPTPVASPTPLPPEQGLSAKEEVVAPNAANATKPAPGALAAPTPAPPAKPEATKPEPAKAETEKPPTAEAKDGAARFVVQVGAYADADKAREARRKLEKAGLKTYTHVAETKEGKRTRVRLGPFATREEADKAADKAKQLDFTPAVLTL